MNPLEQLLQLAGIQQKPSGYDAFAARSTPPGMENLGTLPQDRASMALTPEQAAQMQRLKSSPGIMGDLRRLAGLGNEMGDGPSPKAMRGSGGFGNDLGSLGAGMMTAGARPGATFLGSLGEGLTTMAAGSRQRRKDELAEAREERVARLAEEELGLKRQTTEQTIKDKQRAERNAALALVIPANRPMLAKLIDEGKIDPTDQAGVYDLITKNNLKILPKLEKVGDRLVDTSAEKPTVVLGGKPHFEKMREGTKEVTYQIMDDGSRVRVSEGAAFAPEKEDKTLVKVMGPDGKVTYQPREQAIGHAAPDEAMIVMGPDGKPIFARGGGQSVSQLSGALTQKSQGEVEKDLLDMTAQSQQVNRISGAYKPEYQQLGTRWSNMAAAAKDKLGFKPDEQTAAGLRDFTNYRAEAAQFFTDRLKAMAGAAVTESEGKRQEAYLPTPGTGLFDGDSPEQFKSKLDRMQDFFNNATARLHYVQRNGLTIKDVPIDKMPDVIRDRGATLAREMTNRGLQGDELKAAVRSQLAREFGLLR